MRSFDGATQINEAVTHLVDIQEEIKIINPDDFIDDVRDFYLSYINQTAAALARYALKYDKRKNK